jgi:hypothetical protein
MRGNVQTLLLKNRSMNIVRQIIQWFKKWFWTEPTAKDKPIKATQVLHNYVCVKYKDQWINLRKSEITMWNNLSRKDRRAMAQRFAILEKKGKIRFEKINGRMTCIKNKDYEHLANIRK